jgi:putative transposase
MKKRNTEEQIIRILKAHEGGRSAQGTVPGGRDQRANLLPLESKFGGMEVSEAKRMRELEAESRKLKELVADLSLEDKVLKEIVSKN